MAAKSGLPDRFDQFWQDGTVFGNCDGVKGAPFLAAKIGPGDHFRWDLISCDIPKPHGRQLNAKVCSSESAINEDKGYLLPT